jgi:hypothetical protein
MPRIAKWSERNQCMPPQPVKFKIASSGVNKNRTVIDIEELLSNFDFEKYFKSFVDVKEIPKWEI